MLFTAVLPIPLTFVLFPTNGKDSIFSMMKNTALLLSLLLASVIHAQKESLFGNPDGVPASKEIGAAGGQIMSADGKVELIFPTGALIKNTLISIQPVANLDVQGSGKGYRFEPSGIEFKKPVQMIFHYTDEQAEVCPPDAMAFASQEHDGRRTYFEYDDVDTVSRSIKGFIRHFSEYSLYNQMMLRADTYMLSADDTTIVEIVDTSRISTAGSNIGDFEYASLRSRDVSEWYVNGKKDGDKYFGKLNVLRMPIGKSDKMNATYIAPHYLPAKNPVTIKLVLSYYSKKLGRKVRNPFTCKITLFDVYKITASSMAEVRVGMDNVIVDTGSFFFWIYPDRHKLDNIENEPVTLIKKGSPRIGCTMNLITKDAPGLIHITEGIKNYHSERANELAPLDISFFLSTFDVLTFKFQWICRGVTTPIESVSGKTEPSGVTFYANGEKQEYDIGASIYKCKLTILPFRE